MDASSNGEVNALGSAPGYAAAQCVHLDGSVVVGGQVNQLDTLAKLVSISGDLILNDADSITSGDLGSLDNLVEVGGSLRVLDCDANSLTSLPFSALESVGGDLEIVGNSNLLSLGYDQLTAVGGAVTVQDNGSLCETAAVSDFETRTGLSASSSGNDESC